MQVRFYNILLNAIILLTTESISTQNLMFNDTFMVLQYILRFAQLLFSKTTSYNAHTVFFSQQFYLLKFHFGSAAVVQINFVLKSHVYTQSKAVTFSA